MVETKGKATYINMSVSVTNIDRKCIKCMKGIPHYFSFENLEGSFCQIYNLLKIPVMIWCSKNFVTPSQLIEMKAYFNTKYNCKMNTMTFP